MDPATLAVVLTFAIPIIAIVGGLFMDWAKMREKQKALGTSNQELEQKIARLERDNAEKARRLENLETIVVSQTWSAVQRGAAVAPHELPVPAAEEMNRQRAEQLARRLGG